MTIVLQLAALLIVAWLPGAVLFHAGIWIAMGLDYSAQAATAVVVFANWPVIVGALRARRSAPAAAGSG